MLRAIGKSVRSLLREDDGGEVIEYALVAGLIVVLCLLCITGVGTKVLQRWNTMMQDM